jgi:hypothetical protein
VTASPLATCRRAALVALVVVAAFAGAGLLVSAPAMAKSQTSCADQVVADWFDNLRVDKIYPKHCYREAIAGLGPDIKDYTGAEDAILRALQYANSGRVVNDGSGPGSIHKPIELRRYAIDASTPTTTATQNTSSTAGPSSIPIPLIVLAGLAGLLLIAGGAGYVARRAQARRDDGSPPDA